MKHCLPKLYPITNVQLSGLSHCEQVAQLISGGATFIQIREKTLSPAEFFHQALEAVNWAHENDVQIIINDRVDVALATKADGVHLGQNDLAPEAARDILGRKAIIGFSTHSIEQFRQALSLPLDYVALGPIFNTATKADPEPTLGLEAIRAAAKMAGATPIVAIGGITASNAPSVLDAGATSVAVISSLLAGPNRISDRTNQFLRALNQLKSRDKQI